MEKIFLQTQRLTLREMGQEDAAEVASMLSDPEVMYAWEHTFTSEEVADWIACRVRQYREYGYSYFLAVERGSGETVGQIGLLPQMIEGEFLPDLGWILNKRHWHRGYAMEGGAALIRYAFETLRLPRVAADIRNENLASRRVAERLGMTEAGRFDKMYRGKVMPHILYEKRNPAP